MASYYWVLETDTRGVKSMTIEGPYSMTAKPSYSNPYSSLVGLYGPYTSIQAADAKIQALGGQPNPNASQSGTGDVPVANSKGQETGTNNPSTGQTTSTGNQDTNPGVDIPGLAQIGAFFAALSEANTWIRVAKVVIGGTLVVVGLAHITGADNAVAKAARRIPLPL